MTFLSPRTSLIVGAYTLIMVTVILLFDLMPKDSEYLFGLMAGFGIGLTLVGFSTKAKANQE